MNEAELKAALEKTQAELKATQAELEQLRGREAMVLEAHEQIEALTQLRKRLDDKMAFYDRKLGSMEAALEDTEKKMSFIESKSFLGVNWLFFSVNVVLALVFIAATAHACRS